MHPNWTLSTLCHEMTDYIVYQLPVQRIKTSQFHKQSCTLPEVRMPPAFTKKANLQPTFIHHLMSTMEVDACHLNPQVVPRATNYVCRLSWVFHMTTFAVYRNLLMLFRMVASLTPYGLLFPKIGGSQPPPNYYLRNG